MLRNLRNLRNLNPVPNFARASYGIVRYDSKIWFGVKVAATTCGLQEDFFSALFMQGCIPFWGRSVLGTSYWLVTRIFKISYKHGDSKFYYYFNIGIIRFVTL